MGQGLRLVAAPASLTRQDGIGQTLFCNKLIRDDATVQHLHTALFA